MVKPSKTCVHACMHACMYVCMYVYIYIHIRLSCLSVSHHAFAAQQCQRAGSYEGRFQRHQLMGLAVIHLCVQLGPQSFSTLSTGEPWSGPTTWQSHCQMGISKNVQHTLATSGLLLKSGLQGASASGLPLESKISLKPWYIKIKIQILNKTVDKP